MGELFTRNTIRRALVDEDLVPREFVLPISHRLRDDPTFPELGGSVLGVIVIVCADGLSYQNVFIFPVSEEVMEGGILPSMRFTLDPEEGIKIVPQKVARLREHPRELVRSIYSLLSNGEFVVHRNLYDLNYQEYSAYFPLEEFLEVVLGKYGNRTKSSRS